MPNSVGTLTAYLNIDTRQLKKAQTQVKGFATSTKAAFKTIAPFAGFTAAAIAVTELTRAVVGFEKEMSNVKALTAATDMEFSALNETAKELGRTTQFTAKEAAEGMGFLAMAGFEANQIVAAMPSTLQLASAATIDLGRAADITSNILTGYGKTVGELGHVNDVLVKAFTSANVNLSMLGEAMKFVGPVAKSAGVEFEEAAAAIGLLGNAGIQGGLAGTSLRNAISRLIKPVGRAKEIVKELNLEVLDSAGKFTGISSIVKQLEVALADMGGAGERTAVLIELFGLRAGPAMATLVDKGSVAIDNFTESLRDSEGIAKRIAEEKLKNLSGAWTILKSAVTGAAIDMAGNLVPALTATVKWVTTLVPAVTEIWKLFEAIPLGFIEGLVVANKELDGISNEFDRIENQARVIDFSELFNLKRWATNTIDIISTVASQAARGAVAVVNTVWNIIKGTTKAIVGFANIAIDSLRAIVNWDASILEQSIRAAKDTNAKSAMEMASDFEAAGTQMAVVWDGLWERIEARNVVGVINNKKQIEQITKDTTEIINAGATKSIEAITLVGEKYNITMTSMEEATRQWGSQLSSTLADVITEGALDFDRLLKSFIRMIAQMAIQMKIIQPMMDRLFRSDFGSSFGSLFNANIPSPGDASFIGPQIQAVKKMAKGGVLNGPTRLANGAAIGGEAGPEGVLPLERMANGDLGVQTSGGGAGGGMTVNIINNTSSEVTTKKGNDGKSLEIMIDEVMARKIVSGKTATQLQKTYNVRPGRAGR